MLLFSHLVMYNTLQPHWLQYVRLPCSISHSLFKFRFIRWVMTSNHLVLGHPLLLSSVFPNIRIISNEAALRIKWPKYWSFSFSIYPPNEYSELASFKIDWFDLLAVQGTLQGLCQHHSSAPSVLWSSAFYGPTLTSIHVYWKNPRS